MQLSIPAVPNGKGEHADGPLDCLANSKPHECFKQNFRIGMSAPSNPTESVIQFRPNFSVVINFSVENKDESPVVGVHWLVAGRRQINDSQAPMPQKDTCVFVLPDIAVVGTTPLDCTEHGSEV